MGKLPEEIKLTRHAKIRLEERKDTSVKYNTKNIIKSFCKWYTKDDLIPNSALYRHSLYVCRKSPCLGYVTDGNIEVLYNKNTKIAITVLEVKEKFKPITQYIKPSVFKNMKKKKELRKNMKASEKKIGTCPDCGQIDVIITSQGICAKCRMRKFNAKYGNKEYISIIAMTNDQKEKINKNQIVKNKLEESFTTDINMISSENYYTAKAEQASITPVTPIINNTIKNSNEIKNNTFNSLSDQDSFVNILRGCGCEIPEDSLREVLKVLVSTNELRDTIEIITKNESQNAILDLEQALNVVERKLQHNWEYNGFQEADDIKFKGFLTWRRVLKGAIFFWKKLYSSSTIIELQKAWTAYNADPTEKTLMANDRITSSKKRYQITTDSISTIFNTRRPFTRVFYATTKDEAYDTFVKWMSERQLHEDKSKTTIVELSSTGEDRREI